MKLNKSLFFNFNKRIKTIRIHQISLIQSNYLDWKEKIENIKLAKILFKNKLKYNNIIIYSLLQLLIFIFSLSYIFLFSEPYISLTPEISYTQTSKDLNLKSLEINNIFEYKNNSLELFLNNTTNEIENKIQINNQISKNNNINTQLYQIERNKINYLLPDIINNLRYNWIENSRLLGINIKNISILLFLFFLFTLIYIYFLFNFNTTINNNNLDSNIVNKKKLINSSGLIGIERKGLGIIIIIMIIALSGILLVSDMIQLFLLIELYSLISYVLVLYKFNYNIKTYSILYFLIGNISSALILIGILLLYLFSSSLSLIESNNLLSYFYLWENLYNYNINYTGSQIGLLFIIIGLLFKLGIFPFIFWIIKIYPLLENKIFSYLLILPQIVYLFKLSEILSFLSSSFLSFFLFSCSIFSILLGSILGLNYSKFKLIFVSSSILNMGYLLLILSLISYTTINSFILNNLKETLPFPTSLKASRVEERVELNGDKDIENNIFEIINNYFLSSIYLYYYIFIYSLLSLNLLFLFFNSQFYNNNILLTNKNKWILFSFLCTIFSFIGFPPFSGFYPKFFLIKLIYSINSYIYFPFGFILIILSSILSGIFYLFIFIYKLKNSLSNNNNLNIKQDNINNLENTKILYKINWNINLFISFLTLFILFCSYFNPFLISYFDFLSF